MLACLIAIGLALAPPPGFAPDASVPLGRSAAAAPALDPRAPRFVDAAFADAADRAELVVSRVEAPLDASEETKDALAVALGPHYRRYAGAELAIAWADPPARTGYIEMAGTLGWSGHKRALRIAWVPQGRRHFVVALTAPPDRIDALEPAFAAAVHAVGPPKKSAAARDALWATLAAAAIAVAWTAARFRRARS